MASVGRIGVDNILSFKPVVGEGREERFKVVQDLFTRFIVPMYGPQEDFIKKIQSGEDHVCRLLYNRDVPVGLIVFKRALSNQYSLHKVMDSLEISTLCLTDPATFSGRGYGTKLLDRILEVAKDLDAQSVHTTVNEASKDAVAFFQKKQFRIAHTFNAPERKFLLVRSLKEEGAKYHEAKEKKASEPHGTKRKKPEDEVDSVDSSEKKLRTECQLGVPLNTSGNGTSTSHSRNNDSSGTSSNSTPNSSSSSSSSSRQGSSDPRSRDNTSGSHSTSSTSSRNGYVDNKSRERTSSSNSNSSSEYGNRSSNISWSSDRKSANASSTGRAYYTAARTNQRAAPDMTLRKVYVNMIQRGTKTIEGRINIGAFARMSAGQTIRFFYQQNVNDDVRCEITRINRYSSFAEMLQKEGVAPCLPDIAERGGDILARGIALYSSIPGYEERAKQFGVVALHLRKL